MSEPTVVDAHALLWYLQGSRKLSQEARQRMSDPNARLPVSVIALAEACWAIGKGKSTVTLAELRFAINSDRRFSVLELGPDVVFAAAELPVALEMHDRLLMATTARERSTDPSTVLLTCDEMIRASNLVPTVW